MHILFLEVAVYAQLLELADRFQQDHRVPGKAGHRLGYYKINFALPAVLQHPLELRAVDCCAGDPVIRVDRNQLPLRVGRNIITVVFCLGLQRVEGGVLIG